MKPVVNIRVNLVVVLQVWIAELLADFALLRWIEMKLFDLVMISPPEELLYSAGLILAGALKISNCRTKSKHHVSCDLTR
jgi:hypothetical protein